jgi:hypothetical protein
MHHGSSLTDQALSHRLTIYLVSTRIMTLGFELPEVKKKPFDTRKLVSRRYANSCYLSNLPVHKWRSESSMPTMKTDRLYATPIGLRLAKVGNDEH